MNKTILAWLVSKAYLACVIIGIVFLLEVTNKVESVTMALIGVVTVIAALLAFKDRDLKLAFFVSGILLFNVSILNYWKDMTETLRITSFVFFSLELVIILLKIYRSFSGTSSRRPMSYTPRPSVGTNVLVNVSAFCKSKHAEKEKVDECISGLLTGGER